MFLVLIYPALDQCNWSISKLKFRLKLQSQIFHYRLPLILNFCPAKSTQKRRTLILNRFHTMRMNIVMGSEPKFTFRIDCRSAKKKLKISELGRYNKVILFNLRQYKPAKKHVEWFDSIVYKGCFADRSSFLTAKSAFATFTQYGQCESRSLYTTEYFQWCKCPSSAVILKSRLFWKGDISLEKNDDLLHRISNRSGNKLRWINRC